MPTVIRHPLLVVWTLLTTVTVVSWWVARDGGGAHQLNAGVTAVVLLLAAAKTVLVISHFMEVRHAPAWLQTVTGGWVVTLFALLWGIYVSGL